MIVQVNFSTTVTWWPWPQVHTTPARMRVNPKECEQLAFLTIRLPIQFRGEVFCNQVFVIRAQLLDVRPLLSLRVQVIGVKFADPSEHLLVAIVHEIFIFALTVRRIER